MSKGVKKILGVVAAIAIPFAAPAIAGALGASSALAGTATGAFLGTAGGSALTGAVLGGAASAATGGDPLTGALLGGLGGFSGAGGFKGLFGGPAATSTNAVSGPMTASLRPVARTAGLSGVAPAATSVAPGAVSAGTGTAVTSTATSAGGLGGFFRQVGQGLLNNPAGMAQLAMAVYGAPPNTLTPAELDNLEDLKRLAETNRELFEQQVRGANEMIQMAAQRAPDPQQAFAENKIAYERQLAEQTRGLGADEVALAQRRAAIRSTQAGATAAAAEEARGNRVQSGLLSQGYGMLPASAPQGAAGLALPMYNALQERKYAYDRDLATAVGDLFGGIA